MSRNPSPIDVTSGAHMGAIRRWVKWHLPGGDRVTWGSDHQWTVTMRQLEEAAQWVAEETSRKAHKDLRGALEFALRSLEQVAQGDLTSDLDARWNAKRAVDRARSALASPHPTHHRHKRP